MIDNRMAELAPIPAFTDREHFRLLARSRLLTLPCGWDEEDPQTRNCPSDWDLNPELPRPFLADETLVGAAVLVPIVARERLTLILTERTAHLSAHAGQIAFPGGKIDAGDAGPADAALREAREEIGLSAADAEPLGYLEPYRTGTGYLITPVVALVAPGFVPRPDPAEVAAVFEVPLDFLMDQANHRVDRQTWRGAERQFYAMPYEQRYIWGATAGIIRALYRRLVAL